jgi:hypothetical protein
VWGREGGERRVERYGESMYVLSWIYKIKGKKKKKKVGTDCISG